MISAVLIFLAWGSYLNSVGYRLLHLESFFKARSFCPSCKHVIAWYDNIPVISWLLLMAQCRHCKQPISWLYPFTEVLTTISLLLLWCVIPAHYFPAYFLFFSALIITIRTDFDHMLISRFVTLYAIPIGCIATIFNKLPLTLLLSISGALFGYVLLWSVQKISYCIAQEESLGQGDLELLAFIGAFTGPLGCWVSLLIGSILGSIISLISMAITRQRIIKIPFGPYLSFGAMIFVCFQNFFMQYFFHSTCL